MKEANFKHLIDLYVVSFLHHILHFSIRRPKKMLIDRKETSRKFNKKELMIIKAYKEYFPSLEKACQMSNTKLIDVLDMMEKDYGFKREMEAVKVTIFSTAEKVLMEILEDKKATATNKISVSRLILQYKKELSRF